MKLLYPLSFLMFAIGCGANETTPKATPTLAHPLAELGAGINRSEYGEIVAFNLRRSEVTDAGLVHLKGLTKLQPFDVNGEIKKFVRV